MRRSNLSIQCLGCIMSMAIASDVVSCGKRETKLIPTSVLFGNPAKTAPQISPDANRLSYLAPYNGVLNVWVRTIGQDDDRAVTRDADRGIKKYFWAYDGIHIMFLQDAAGTNHWRLWGANLRTGEAEDYTPFDSVSVGVVSYSKRFPHELIISMNRDNPYASDAYRLDLDTGALLLAREIQATSSGGSPMPTSSSVARWLRGPGEDTILSSGRVRERHGGSCARGITRRVPRAGPYVSRGTAAACFASTPANRTRDGWSG
ncbi:MAG: hypothetical protein PHD74_09465 [Candidatus Krumholzibacteria bacterium]|nr:hypothetical protein [Candidatus Krumholzibacteria bacterium]